ncbi:hypothetical protein Scep_025255 [Stephania cephalantha]|uniref:Transcription factor IIIC 90kDa subunit N-terminal domain-containing protein n=1 Tax=Stephania cephalantha TaxID=152367 RepID=A0AAP0EHX0_9MAGN
MPTSHFQAAALVAAPLYPDAVAWSDENFVAVAAGHIVTILNPGLLDGPRGLITLPPSKPFEIGVVEREDLLSGCLLPICLSHDTRLSIRSISWSNLGLAPNSGCLLAVCTTEGRVKLYRQPFSEFCAEWIEVADITDLFLDYLLQINFGESDPEDLPESEHSDDLMTSTRIKGCKGRLASSSGKMTLRRQPSLCLLEQDASGVVSPLCAKQVVMNTELVSFPCTLFKKGSSVEVLKQNGKERIWISGTVKRVDGPKVHVLFPGKQAQWVEYKSDPNNVNGSSGINGETLLQDCLVPEIRLSMDVGHFPEQLFLAECSDLKEILSIGQAVEAWTHDRWIEGFFIGCEGQRPVVGLSGDGGHVTLDAPCVRLAPFWNGELKSWQVTVIKIKTEDLELFEAVDTNSKLLKEKNKRLSFPEPTGRSNKKRRNGGSPPLITAEQYFSRIVMLSSTVVAWSPMFQLSPNNTCDLNNWSGNCSLLAVGAKSGKISFWRILGPECYSIERGMASINAMLVGLLEAHNAWITAISWGIIESGAKPSAILVTGCSDGSVRIWLAEIEGLLRSSEVYHSQFSLLNEIVPTYVPISVLSLNTPSKSQDKLLLAVGKGSGSLEIWICDVTCCDFQAAGSYEVHSQAVTGLAWAFDGCCLYSCSQDNSFRGWIMHDKSLHEMLIPSNSLGCSSSSDLPDAFDSCFGLATSPGNTVLAMVRGFDKELLNPMYQARSQKAAVEFFWIGGQQLELSLDRNLGFDIEACSWFSKTELALWEANILWSLNTYDNIDKPLVVWDVIAALLAFKQFSEDYVEHILVKWISSWFRSSYLGSSIDEILLHAPRYLSMIHSRQLHLLNIICRHVIVSEIKSDLIDDGREKLVSSESGQHEQSSLWIGLLISSERELRERLVAFSLAAVLSQKRSSKTATAAGRYWLPLGMAQMEQWIAVNSDCVQDQIKLLASKVKGPDERLSHLYDAEEQCTFCSASVPFESPEVAYCNGKTCSDGTDRHHKLERCAITMQVCPTTTLWFCACCKRRTSKLAPVTLFSLPNSHLDLKSLKKSDAFRAPLKPLCPFCGILLQRLQPRFLLSASPV